MIATEIEQLPEVVQATDVLRLLEERGLDEPAIASGWTRAFLTDTKSKDIDVAYVGDLHFELAQQVLRDVLEELGYDPEPWDISGIWNATMSYGLEHTVENYLLYYVNSIDSVYLASDGKLHDPTGHGFEDAATGTLRINDYDRKIGFTPGPSEEVNICLEGCRRIAQLGWTPTDSSVERIGQGVSNWQLLNRSEVEYFLRKLASKYEAEQRLGAQAVYTELGWGFVFDELKSA